MEEPIFKLSDKLEKGLFEKGHLVFDSSALLGFYGYNDKIIEGIFKNIFTKLENRLWLPAQVVYEFQKNRSTVISKPIQEYLNLIEKGSNKKDGGYLTEIEKSIAIQENEQKRILGQLKTLIEKTKNDNKHPYLKQSKIGSFQKHLETHEKEIKNTKKKFNELKDSINNQIDIQVKKIKAKSTKDELKTKLSEVFKLGKPYSYDRMLEIVEQGKFRYDNEIPPGYKDESEKIGFQIYGDLILWFQTIDYAKENLSLIHI